MSENRSDALVFFGATGDLAYKKIFPSLQGMLKRGHLNVPVIGVAKAGWGLDQFRARARDSLEKHGGVDPVALEKLMALLRYIDGDYSDQSRRRGAAQNLLCLPRAGEGPRLRLHPLRANPLSLVHLSICRDL
jgi:glucose-6-phosphate 1-dehydrogenase